LAVILERIDVRTYNEKTFHAQIHGIKCDYKATGSDLSKKELDPEAEHRAEAAMHQAIERKQWQAQA